jgi:hypothetical protein
MDNTGMVDRRGGELVGKCRRNIPMTGRSGFSYMNFQSRPFPQAVNISYKALNVFGFSRRENDHAKLTAQHTPSCPFDVHSPGGEKFEKLAGESRPIGAHGRKNDE